MTADWHHSNSYSGTHRTLENTFKHGEVVTSRNSERLAERCLKNKDIFAIIAWLIIQKETDGKYAVDQECSSLIRGGGGGGVGECGSQVTNYPRTPLHSIDLVFVL